MWKYNGFTLIQVVERENDGVIERITMDKKGKVINIETIKTKTPQFKDYGLEGAIYNEFNFRWPYCKAHFTQIVWHTTVLAKDLFSIPMLAIDYIEVKGLSNFLIVLKDLIKIKLKGRV